MPSKSTSKCIEKMSRKLCASSTVNMAAKCSKMSLSATVKSDRQGTPCFRTPTATRTSSLDMPRAGGGAIGAADAPPEPAVPPTLSACCCRCWSVSRLKLVTLHISVFMPITTVRSSWRQSCISLACACTDVCRYSSSRFFSPSPSLPLSALATAAPSLSSLVAAAFASSSRRFCSAMSRLAMGRSASSLETNVSRMRPSSARPSARLSSSPRRVKIDSTRLSMRRTQVVCTLVGRLGSCTLQLKRCTMRRSCTIESSRRTWCTSSASSE
mmetsp:Transcript_8747/g.27146  ORF Transcript_8747/g.27146 Transcript_8747/m.27146 type:complete len:270 (-) Transcript_8747:512-1321(-)